MNKLVPILVGAAVVVFLVGAAKASPAPAPTPVPPLPPTPPVPPVPPFPPPTPSNQQQQAVLLQQLQLLLMQASATPGLVDPQQLETLAYQLDAAGLPVQAAQARAAASQIRRGPGPSPAPPVPAPPDVLLAQYAALLQQAMTDPAHTDPVLLDQMAIQLDAANMGYQAQVLRQAAAAVRLKRSQTPPLS